MHRLFAAIAIPEIVADSLSQLQDGLPGARWRSMEQLHITLGFFGDVNRHMADEIAQVLEQITAPAFSVTLSACGYFGGGKPGSVWAGVADSPPLQHLHRKIKSAVSEIGVAMERRKYRPHVTLAYLNGSAQEQVERYCAGHGLYKCGPFPVTEFSLYESHLGNDGSHYERVASYSLAALANAAD